MTQLLRVRYLWFNLYEKPLSMIIELLRVPVIDGFTDKSIIY